ncbi:MAG: alpha/beta hydrolase [Armatimonadetes bacterium]|nr:alpha/beta hydrolase [Planctomycetota bacterium]MBI2201834.1 alpha/beta hydrolase [Armatimonadota bacterium]
MLIRACEPCRYASGGQHGAYYTPGQNPTGGVLLLSPLFEEKRSAHRAMAEFACALADRGMAVLQPDLTGCGNGPGFLQDTSLAQWSEDIRDALSWLRQRSGSNPVYLAGCRMGGLLGGWYLVRRPEAASRLLLWNPVTSGGVYLSTARKRRMIQDSMTRAEERPRIEEREVEGQVLSDALFTGLLEMSLDGLKPPPCEVRLLQCSFNTRMVPELERLMAQWGRDRVRVHCMVSEPFWNAHTPGGYDEVIRTAAEFFIR